MNFFAYRTAAERYARSRPFFHPVVMDRIKAFTGLQEPLEQALDVGCGTGQSTIALKSLARSVVGVDVSAEMLSVAPKEPNVRYARALAEDLPFADASFELLTTSVAFHWFDRPKFMAQAHRLLTPDGWLVIYSNGFYGKMKENPQFERWNWDVYVARYPTPPRNNRPLRVEEAKQYGFRLAHREVYENDVTLTVDQLAAYFTTQSNVIASVEQGTEGIESVYTWLVSELGPLFAERQATFPFGGSIWYLQKE